MGLLDIDVDNWDDCFLEIFIVWLVVRIGLFKKCYVIKLKNYFSNMLIIMYIKSDIVKGVNCEYFKIM